MKQGEFSSSVEHNVSLDETGTISLKIILLGNSNVGKSSILRRFVQDQFDEQVDPTIGVDFMAKTIRIQGKSVRLVIWVRR
jgi:GTPase SAR1 family protein